jgi:hypothetical protein
MAVRRVARGVLIAALGISRGASASCFDGVKNGPESDVDCGGDCPACERGDTCNAPNDCYSGLCAEAVCAERAYEPGSPLLPGYQVEPSDVDGAAITRTVGWVSLAVGYGGAYATALSLPGTQSALYVPVFGPWIKVADSSERLRGLLAVDGLLQTVGVGLVVGGIAASGKQLVKSDSIIASLCVTPTLVGRDGGGVWLGGAF